MRESVITRIAPALDFAPGAVADTFAPLSAPVLRHQIPDAQTDEENENGPDPLNRDPEGFLIL